VDVTARYESLPVDYLEPNPYQPRQQFDRAALGRLADSLQRDGMMQPILVRPVGAGRFQILAGERRWRAARQAGWPTIQVLVREVSELQAAELALVENEHREQVARLDTARAADALMKREGLTHDELAAVLGMERSSVTNLLRLLTLDPAVQALVGEGPDMLSMGHAKLLVGLPAIQQRGFARRALDRKLPVRGLMRLIQRERHRARLARLGQGIDGAAADVADLEQRLTEHLGQSTRIELPGKTGGRRRAGSLVIRYSSLDELEGVLERLGFRSNPERSESEFNA
jgi:ParB family transcriptional regulator, chromosome partitioning protein